MGTNYYVVMEGCDACNRPHENLHIGKSSAGWAFSLRLHRHIRSLGDWKELWSSGVEVVNEYGDGVTIEEMIDRITNRANPDKNEDNLRRAAATMAPHCLPDFKHGLLRHVNAEDQSFNHDVTYDYCDYEFC